MRSREFLADCHREFAMDAEGCCCGHQGARSVGFGPWTGGEAPCCPGGAVLPGQRYHPAVGRTPRGRRRARGALQGRRGGQAPCCGRRVVWTWPQRSGRPEKEGAERQPQGWQSAAARQAGRPCDGLVRRRPIGHGQARGPEGQLPAEWESRYIAKRAQPCVWRRHNQRKRNPLA